MSAGRRSCQHKFCRIKTVLFCVVSGPSQCAPTVLDRRRSRRIAREAILDVYHRPTKRQVRQELKYVALFLTINPPAAVKENQRRVRRAAVLWQVQVQL